MKKLMIAAAIVCAAVCGQAAQATWVYSIRNVVGVDNTGTYAGGPITLYAAITGTGDWFEVAEGNQNFSAGKLPTAQWKSAEKPADPPAGAQYVEVGKYYDFYFTIVDTNSEGQEVKYTSNVVENKAAVGTGFTTIDFGNLSGKASNVWVASAVPEPTSGLLLLLGVAGMALRRRRA